MRLYVVEINDGGAEGDYETLEDFTKRLKRDWVRGKPLAPTTKAYQKRHDADHDKMVALDEALLATINVAHVGMVIQYRMGWVFCAEDASG